VALWMGVNSLLAFNGERMNRPWNKGEEEHYTEMATKVLTLAKIHQIDAIRVALLEHGIDPRFSAPIVADVCFGGASRKL
jgi:hypothetical protein